MWVSEHAYHDSWVHDWMIFSTYCARSLDSKTVPYEDSKTVSVHLSIPREKKSPWLLWYQSEISNWYINGKVFMSTTTWKPKKLFFFQKSSKLSRLAKLNFVRTPRKQNRPGFADISPTLVTYWYINRKVFISSTALIETQKVEFLLKKFEIVTQRVGAFFDENHRFGAYAAQRVLLIYFLCDKKLWCF